MSEHCLFPNCGRHPEKNGYCVGHGSYANAVAVKKPRPINPESKKTREVKDALKTIYPRYLKKHPFCKIKSPECTKIAECVHHTEGRGDDVVLDQTTWLPSCTRCNSFVEIHDAWARERGFKKYRIK